MKGSQPENFDSTAKLMIEALAKASAELEKSVTGFTEQLISFNQTIQKSFEEEVHAVEVRLEAAVKGNLDELGHSKHVIMKRLLEAERAELDRLADVGRQVRTALSANAVQIENKIETFMANQIKELRDFLQQPQDEIVNCAQQSVEQVGERVKSSAGKLRQKQQEFRQQLSDKISELERSIKMETEQAREAIKASGEFWGNTLKSERESFLNELEKVATDAVGALDKADAAGNQNIDETQSSDIALLENVLEKWQGQMDAHGESFQTLISSLGHVLKENFDTKLSNAAEQARQEIGALSRQAHEKISATRSELEIELRALEKEYILQLESTLKKLEAVVSEHGNDKRNSGVARQHKAQKLRDQMHTHLRRFGSSLVDSIKDAVAQLENEFNRATDGFQARIEGARSAAVELLERETKLMQRDLDRVLKDFQRELSEEEAQINKIENAGQDAVVTVIACRKAMLSFKGE